MMMCDIDPLNLHPQATQLALLLYARLKFPDFHDVIQENIATQFAHYTDEQKADLYALLEEGVTNDMTLGQLHGACDKLLWKNSNHFGGVY